MAYPARIASICPSNTEILFSLGVGDRVVGVDDYSDWPAAVERLPRLGPDQDIDMQRLAAMEPDLVVASLTVPGMEKNVRRLEEGGFPFVVLQPALIDDIWEDIRFLGRLLGVADRAHSLIEESTQRLEAVRVRVREVESTPRVYWEWWPKPLMSPGAANWLTPLTEIAGGVSIFADRSEDRVVPREEEVLARDPEVVLVCWPGVRREKIPLEKVRSRPGWQSVSAYRQGRIHAVEEGRFCRPSPRLVDGLEELVSLLHPGR